jgi:hypothetical protein
LREVDTTDLGAGVGGELVHLDRGVGHDHSSDEPWCSSG